jgi:hypothetical protein
VAGRYGPENSEGEAKLTEDEPIAQVVGDGERQKTERPSGNAKVAPERGTH